MDTVFQHVTSHCRWHMVIIWARPWWLTGPQRREEWTHRLKKNCHCPQTVWRFRRKKQHGPMSYAILSQRRSNKSNQRGPLTCTGTRANQSLNICSRTNNSNLVCWGNKKVQKCHKEEWTNHTDLQTLFFIYIYLQSKGNQPAIRAAGITLV